MESVDKGEPFIDIKCYGRIWRVEKQGQVYAEEINRGDAIRFAHRWAEEEPSSGIRVFTASGAMIHLVEPKLKDVYQFPHVEPEQSDEVISQAEFD